MNYDVQAREPETSLERKSHGNILVVSTREIGSDGTMLASAALAPKVRSEKTFDRSATASLRKRRLSRKGDVPSQQGVILIALLWVLVALSLIAMSFASVVRLEVQAARASGDSEKAYFFARGALESVLYRLGYPDNDVEKQKKRFCFLCATSACSVSRWSVFVTSLQPQRHRAR